ncbi:MAG: glycoside hydrolase family 15 protein [Gammaproteobacteria bacterium]|jgi:GH15 family glucan-1,4-alpha-glucosidase
MAERIEEYGLIGNTLTAALVSRMGSIDWCCLPRFDGDACFASLLGKEEHGFWRIKPVGGIDDVHRRYLPGTAVLETTFETRSGKATLIDFMPFSEDERFVDVVRIVRGVEGRVDFRMDAKFRFGYGHIVPWVRRRSYGISAVAGPDAVQLRTPVELRGEDWTTVAEFSVDAGADVPFVLTWYPSHRSVREPGPAGELLESTSRTWREWSDRCSYGREREHSWHQAVTRSLITLKLLTFTPTGGMVAAPTTSVPVNIGGERNFDYRYCWIRDATLTMYSLLMSGYEAEARAWRQWLLRAAAGEPRQLQILYGLAGERRLTELELPWLPGYERSAPVRIGNAAFDQRQLDVPGELLDMLHVGRKHALEVDGHGWELQKEILRRLEDDWQQPDRGIWEVRAGPRHFTFSRIMCWVAFDRAVRAVEEFGLDGPVEEWRKVRDRIRDDIERNGWNEQKQSFVQSYGSAALDASLLLIAHVGFLPASDKRYRLTVEAIERELVEGGLVRRYLVDESVEGVPGDEATFLPCSFWLADAYVLLGRRDDAIALFERLLSLRNDLGLLSEQYDPAAGRQLGNFPQAFTHVALVNTANNLVEARGPAVLRGEKRKAASDSVPV